MNFRMTVRCPGDRGVLCFSESSLAGDVFTVYRRLAGTFGQSIEIFDFRGGEGRPITGSELEAIAQRERHDRRRAATDGGGGAPCNSHKP